MRKFLMISLTAISFIATASAQKSIGIVAHRGYWNCEEAGYARNSIAALKCAQEAGFWGSEFDVNMTADGVLLVYHDSDIDGKRIDSNPYEIFKDKTLENGEKIPTLDDYFEQANKHPETMLVFELKSLKNKELEKRFVDLAIEKVKEHGLDSPDRIMFISFSYYICKKLAKKMPGYTVQYLSVGGTKSPRKLHLVGISGIDYYHKFLKLKPKWYKQAKKLNMSINTWTVNKEKDIRDMVATDIDQITTDYPIETREILKELGITELQ